MKKLNLLFSFLLCISANAAKAEIPMTPVFPEPQLGYEPEMAMSVGDDGQAVFQPAIVHKSGQDFDVTVYGPNFAVEKQFTLKNVLKSGYDACYCDELYLMSVDMQDIVVTRNFFVKNDKWCIAVVNYKENGDDEICTLYDEDGKEVGDASFMRTRGMTDIVLDGIYKGAPYLVEHYELGENADSYYQLYTFTAKSGVLAVKVASFNRAYPNPLPSGQTFTVDFTAPADDATYFCVVDMKGRQIYRRKVAAGETSYKLSGSRFGQGHYVYTVVYGDGQSVSGRLMVE